MDAWSTRIRPRRVIEALVAAAALCIVSALVVAPARQHLAGRLVAGEQGHGDYQAVADRVPVRPLSAGAVIPVTAAPSPASGAVLSTR